MDEVKKKFNSKTKAIMGIHVLGNSTNMSELNSFVKKNNLFFKKIATKQFDSKILADNSFNLIFGWAHHTYLVPSETWIRTFAYFVSMTELYIFGKIIWDWRGSLEQWEINRHITAYRFLFAADIWVFLNLGLALIISVPIFNLYTHGTHIIVAHAMGSTIGINTMVLLSSIFFIINESKESQLSKNQTKKVIHGFWIANISLAIFLVALILAGIGKGLLYTDMPFQAMMFNIRPFLVVFTLAGITLMFGLWIVLWRAYQSIGVLYSSLEDISEQDSLKEGLS